MRVPRAVGESKGEWGRFVDTGSCKLTVHVYICV